MGFEIKDLSFQNNIANNFKFNKIEHIKDYNLGINQAFFRTHDPQIARMWQIDYWNTGLAMITGTGNILSPTTMLNHEFDHAARWDTDSEGMKKDAKVLITGYGNLEEKRVIIGSEVRTAKGLKEIGPKDMTRSDHFDTMLPVNGPLSTDIEGPTVKADKSNN